MKGPFVSTVALLSVMLMAPAVGISQEMGTAKMNLNQFKSWMAGVPDNMHKMCTSALDSLPGEHEMVECQCTERELGREKLLTRICDLRFEIQIVEAPGHQAEAELVYGMTYGSGGKFADEGEMYRGRLWVKEGTASGVEPSARFLASVVEDVFSGIRHEVNEPKQSGKAGGGAKTTPPKTIDHELNGTTVYVQWKANADNGFVKEVRFSKAFVPPDGFRVAMKPSELVAWLSALQNMDLSTIKKAQKELSPYVPGVRCEWEGWRQEKGEEPAERCVLKSKVYLQEAPGKISTTLSVGAGFRRLKKNGSASFSAGWVHKRVKGKYSSGSGEILKGLIHEALGDKAKKNTYRKRICPAGEPESSSRCFDGPATTEFSVTGEHLVLVWREIDGRPGVDKLEIQTKK